MATKAVVFVGSSVTDRDLEWAGGWAEVRPPIRRGDLPDVVSEGYGLIGIIDGEFFQNLAVSPKEILAALYTGRTVVGGASMGALRAAELSRYGMHGVGVVFRWYRSGIVTRDDDVALKYAADDGIYRPLTVPMVNVRWVVAAGRSERWLDPSSARRVMAAARRIHWSVRTWPRVAVAAGVTGAERQALLSYATDPDHDLKRLDALAVLNYVKQIARDSAARDALLAQKDLDQKDLDETAAPA
jgi:hypothetical protein